MVAPPRNPFLAFSVTLLIMILPFAITCFIGKKMSRAIWALARMVSSSVSSWKKLEKKEKKRRKKRKEMEKWSLCKKRPELSKKFDNFLIN